MKYTEEEKMYDYNKIMMTDTMSIEEAEMFIDEMYQDRYKIMEEKSENGVTIHLDKLNDVKFTNLEFASVILLRELQSLRRKIEKQQKEIEKYKELLNSNIGVDLSYDDYISKEAIR